MWMVRAGEGAFLIDKFKDENRVVIGWELGDLSHVKNLDEIKKLLKHTYPEKKVGQINIAASQINKFLFDFQKGDYVLSYDSENRVYHVGKIISDYIFDETFYSENEFEYCDVREVKWEGEVRRDDLSTPTKNTLGAISTLFEINPNAVNEIISVLKGEQKPKERQDEEDEELEILKENLQAKSREFIKDKILELDWDDMQDLVAGLLRAMGYKTFISPKGPDRGKDIFASPDGLGLKNPRILVEVKHRKGQIGAPEVRSFIGGLRTGDMGLYVSSGGFSKEAKYEAERANNPITLIDIEMLVNIILQYYDNFDPDARTLIPLTKIYWPA